MTCQCLKRRVTRGSVPSRATLWLRPVSTRRKAASKANGPGKGVPAKWHNHGSGKGFLPILVSFHFGGNFPLP